MTDAALPPPIRGSDPNSFAAYTITTRLPAIVERVLRDGVYSPDIAAKLIALRNDLPHGRARALIDRTQGAPDAAAWDEYVRPYLGATWLELPWYFAEAYFYRRIIEAVGYDEAIKPEGDPYRSQKQKALEDGMRAAPALCAHIDEQSSERAQLEELVLVSLWGNQADLSMWSASDQDRPDHLGAGTGREHLLADDSAALVDHLYLHLMKKRGARLDILADNCGIELVADLCLVERVIADSGDAASIHLHVKGFPTFVSDATVADCRETIARLAENSDPRTAALGKRLGDAVATGRLVLREHPMWTSPLGFRVMPEELCRDLARSSLILSKGDANYRRFLDDRHWPHDTPLAQALAYMPRPVALLRTLKSEIAVGLDAEAEQRASRRDSHWLTSGAWGVIQYYNPA